MGRAHQWACPTCCRLCGTEFMMMTLLLFLQKQNLASAIYLFGLGTRLSGPGLKTLNRLEKAKSSLPVTPPPPSCLSSSSTAQSRRAISNCESLASMLMKNCMCMCRIHVNKGLCVCVCVSVCLCLSVYLSVCVCWLATVSCLLTLSPTS